MAHRLNRSVVLGGATLSEREADLLRYLANAPERTVSRDELLQSVWGIDPRGVRTRTVDVHVARLREKLQDDPADPSVEAELLPELLTVDETIRALRAAGQDRSN